MSSWNQHDQVAKRALSSLVDRGPAARTHRKHGGRIDEVVDHQALRQLPIPHQRNLVNLTARSWSLVPTYFTHRSPPLSYKAVAPLRLFADDSVLKKSQREPDRLETVGRLRLQCFTCHSR